MQRLTQEGIAWPETPGASVQSSLLGTYLIVRVTLADFSTHLLRMFMQKLSSRVFYKKAGDILRISLRWDIQMLKYLSILGYLLLYKWSPHNTSSHQGF